jgi:hypothetical protein
MIPAASPLGYLPERENVLGSSDLEWSLQPQRVNFFHSLGTRTCGVFTQTWAHTVSRNAPGPSTVPRTG